MSFKCRLFVFCLTVCSMTDSLNLYHTGSNLTLVPESDAGYFGYSVALTESGLIVGAPKAFNGYQNITTGLVFNCSTQNLYAKISVKCRQLDFDQRTFRRRPIDNIFVNDMWFGAVVVSVSKEHTLVCAPHWLRPFSHNHYLANGLCVVYAKNTPPIVLTPLQDMNRQPFLISGGAKNRPEYGQFGGNLNFYAYGQAGFSIAVTANQSVVLGAPGLVQWAGGVVTYNYFPDASTLTASFRRQATMNPFYTLDLKPDDYFGYSVASGVFDSSGIVLYVAAAPRGYLGYGKVIIFDPPKLEGQAITIRFIIKGPKLGAYFGSTLCSLDIDGDGITELLVGAPTFVNGSDYLPYDQGAVFVYRSQKKGSRDFVMENTGILIGSAESGARFGTSIADLGDVDDDGYRDVAVGAPYENDGAGAVYIYRGCANGLLGKEVQRIVSEKSRGFGISISKGYDVDHNKCNDLAVGAHESSSALIFRCVPTISVAVSVASVVNTSANVTKFQASFCVNVDRHNSRWKDASVHFKAKMIVDGIKSRAYMKDDDVADIILSPGADQSCLEPDIYVQPTADLTDPISLAFKVNLVDAMKEGSQSFKKTAVRISENSTLTSESHYVQLTRDCGDNMVCEPFLNMTVAPLEPYAYIPGLSPKLGALVTILNTEEPAYGAMVNITLPFPLKRVPEYCTLVSSLNVTCAVPAPLLRDHKITWEFDLEYTQHDSKPSTNKLIAELKYKGKDGPIHVVQTVKLVVKPQATFKIVGKALPNTTVSVTRKIFYEKGLILVIHHFDVINYGPSDWTGLEALIKLPTNVSLTKVNEGCSKDTSGDLECLWQIPAKTSLPIMLTLRVDISYIDHFLEEMGKWNVVSTIFLFEQNLNTSVTSTLLLEPAQSIWPILVGVASGLILLGIIVALMFMMGFFERKSREELKSLLQEGPESHSHSMTPLSAPGYEALDHSDEALIADTDSD